MKQLINIFLIFFTFSMFAFSQDCSCNSDACQNYWSQLSYDYYIPSSHKDTMTIFINLNIIQDDNGGNNFPDNQETLDHLTTAVNFVNQHYRNVDTLVANPIHPSYDPPHIDNSLIQFEVLGINFFQDSYFNTSGNRLWTNNYVLDEGHQNIKNAINVNFTEHEAENVAGVANTPSRSQWSKHLSVSIFQAWTKK